MKKILFLLFLFPIIGNSQIIYNCCGNIPTPTTNTSPLTFVDASTTGSLVATYQNDTLTATANGRLANQDGIKLNIGDVLLVKDQNNTKLQNGEYFVFDTGTTTSKYKLVRPDYYDTTTEIYPSQVNVLRGTTNGGKYYLQTTVNPIVGTDPIVYIVTPAPPNPIYPISFVDVHTTTILPNSPVYTSGTNTLTPALNATYTGTSNGIFPTLQGIPPFSGMRILVKDQADQTKNGDYVLTTVGSAVSKWKITRISYTQALLYNHLWEVLQGTDKGYIYQQNNASLVNSTIGITGNILFYNITTNITGGTNTTVIRSGQSYTINAIQTTTLTGDVTGIGTGTINTTLSNSGVSAGTYTLSTITVDAKGRVTSASSGTVGASGWLLTGNSGTVDGTNFLGTTDNVPFTFRVNNIQAGKITSNSNTSYGYQSLLVSGDNLYNTAIGSRALINNTTGRENTALGNQCMEDNTIGIRNTIIGHEAAQNGGVFQGNRNTGIGLVVLGGNAVSPTTVTANDNVAIGYQTLGKISTGNNNTGVGSINLASNTTGTGNTAVGYGSMYYNITGNYTTSIGFSAGVLATGNFGIFLGDSAGYSETGNNKLHIGIHNSPYLDGDMTAGAKTFSIAAATTTTLSNSYANTPTAHDSTTKVATTLYADRAVAAKTITLIGDATGSGTNTITVTNTYPTAWSSTTTITIGAVTTPPTKATTVQNDFVRYRTMSPVIGSTPKTVRADYMYSATSSTGSAAGSGNYLFTLPGGFSFNSTEHAFYTGTNVLAAGSLSIYALGRGATYGMVYGDGFYDLVLIVPYDATRFRIMPIGGNASNVWVGSGWYPITQNTKVMSFQFDFFVQ